MSEYIAMDVHKRYSFVAREGVVSRQKRGVRLEHCRGAVRRYFSRTKTQPGTAVAVEATGNWYWVVTELEEAGLKPRLVHPYKAKMMLACVNKTDKLDADGLNRLQRVGTLPMVWIAPGELRDQRELPRTRMFVSRQSTQLKNRIQATLTKYGLQLSEEFSDPFGKAAQVAMREQIKLLPAQAQYVTGILLEQLASLRQVLGDLEKRMEVLIKQTPAMQRLQTLPGVGKILATVIALEIGDIERFAGAPKLASYSGTTPRVHSSGGKTRYGRLRADVNRYLKWAFLEAANCVHLHQKHYPDRFVTQLYRRLAKPKGHPKAIGAVARHLAEAAWHVLNKQCEYREPAPQQSGRRGSTRRA